MFKKIRTSDWRSNLFLYMISQGVSLIGSTIVSFSIMWYVTLETGSGIYVAVVTVTTYLPQALVMLFGGVLADKYSPKKIIMMADSMVAVSTLILAILFLMGYNNIGLIFFFNSLRSLGTGIQMPAIKSMLPLLVPPQELMRANSMSTSIWCISQLVSPGVSGIMMSFIPMAGIFFIDVITAMIGVSLLWLIPMSKQIEISDSYNPIKELKLGVHYILSNHKLKNSIIFYSIFSFLIIPAAQLTPLLASQALGSEVWILSTIETAFAVGALSISMYLSYKALAIAPYKLIGFSAILFGLTMILLIPCKSIILFTALMFIMGIGSPLYYTPLTTYIQEITEEEYLGRTFSFIELFSTLAIPLGMMIFAPLFHLNVAIPFVIPGVLLILLGLNAKHIS